MIPKIIKKKGEKGSGGGIEAFKPGIRYPWEKATSVVTRNVSGTTWEEVADEMILTAEQNQRVQKPYYHLVLSWHEHENPTDEQMIEAAEMALKALGLEDYQAVIGTHRDTKKPHVHIALNTVHPETFKAWSKSHDMMRLEKACREIELKQGWTRDRGRFDVEVAPDGSVELVPDRAAYEQKKKDREDGKRKRSDGAHAREKNTGFETFSDGIPDALKARFAEAVAEAYDWQSFHMALGEIGLTYYKHGSGARVGILGSEEFAKASEFGSKFSIKKMIDLLGEYEDAESEYVNDLKEDHKEFVSASGGVSEEDQRRSEASTFKLTLLRRIYVDLWLDPDIAAQIKFVDLKDAPPQITLSDRNTIVDHGNKITASGGNDLTNARIMIAMGRAKGWSTISFNGSAEFIETASIEAARQGMPVTCKDPDLQARCDAITERQERQQRRIEAEAKAAQKAALDGVAGRDEAIKQNDAERAKLAALEDEVTEETEGLLAELGWLGEDMPKPVKTAFKKAIEENAKEKKSGIPDRRTVKNPQKAPDAARHDRAGARRIERVFRENDRDELDQMRRVHIDEVAAECGWSRNTRHHDGYDGTRERTFTKGSVSQDPKQKNHETIKASFKGGVWLWTNNKTGQDGTVVDLWLADNPGKTLGDARQAFRKIMGSGYTPPVRITETKEVARDHTAARQRWEQAPYIGDKRTYAEDRGVSRATLQRFRDQVRCGVFGGIYFAHRNPESGDIQGFEQRWEKDGEKNKARFAKGGLKTVSVLGNPETASRMVVFEGGLDALALAEIESRDDTLYVSTGGGFGPRTEAAILKLAAGREVFSGFDNDAAGKVLDAKLRAFLPSANRYAPPARAGVGQAVCKDWLDVLNARKSSVSPAPAMPVQVRAVGEGAGGSVDVTPEPVPDTQPEGIPDPGQTLDDALDELREFESQKPDDLDDTGPGM